MAARPAAYLIVSYGRELRVTTQKIYDHLSSVPLLPGEIRKVVVLPDIHVPYHSIPRIASALVDVEDADHIIILGDLLDAYPLMSHLKDPLRKHSFMEEVRQARSILRLFRNTNPLARIDLIEGNHEDRLRRYLWKNAPALAETHPDVPTLLELDLLNITWHNQDGFYEYDARFKHGKIVRPQSGYSARAEMERHRTSGYSGHTHRLGHATRTDAEGRRTSWWECGHLMLDSAADYVSSPDWQAGYLVVYINSEGFHTVVPVYL